MTLLFGACVSPSVDPPLPTHCRFCEGCDRPIGHCGRAECAPEGDLPEPGEPCGCVGCPTCIHAEAETCTEDDEHRTCLHHLNEAKGDEHD